MPFLCWSDCCVENTNLSSSEGTFLIPTPQQPAHSSVDQGLTTDQLSRLARYGNASWPAIRAITIRIVNGEPLERLLDALEACGPDSAIKIPSDKPPDLPSLADSILSRPSNFPLGWVVVVERWHSLGHVELPLAKVATEKQWVPNL